MKKTKIICTIGPSSSSIGALRKMHAAGMNCARINTAHGDFPQYVRIINNVRKLGRVPVMVDVKGPEIRVLAPSPRKVKKGERFSVAFGGKKGLRFTCDFRKDVKKGDQVVFANGAVRTRVVAHGGDSLLLEALWDGSIEDRKGVNVPGRRLDIPGLSKRDRKSIAFSLRKKVEFLAISFVRDAEDVRNVRKIVGDRIGVISKIENGEGVRNIQEIIGESDGIMIARGDLGVEMPSERIPLIQKDIIRQCNQRGRIAITATQMLESMVTSQSPTRAETSDVANAILDGSDAVMLSGETAIGKHPVKTVRTMANIASEVENSVPNRVQMTGYFNISDTISKSIHHITENMPLEKIVPITRSGYTARMIARFRLDVPIIAVTDNQKTLGQLGLVFGVVPVQIRRIPKTKRILWVAEHLYGLGILHRNERVLFTAGVRTSRKHASNLIEIHNVGELLKFSDVDKGVML